MSIELLRMGLGTPDCPVFKGMFEYAVLAAGGSLVAARMILDGEADVAFNPSGGYHHAHAESESKDMLRDMGFDLRRPSLRGPDYHLVWAERERRGNAPHVVGIDPKDEVGTHAGSQETRAPTCT